MGLFEQLGKDLNPNHGIDLTVNKDISFTIIQKRISTMYREQLRSIAHGIDININKLLDMLSQENIDQAIKNHKANIWQHPESFDGAILISITKVKDIWWLKFVGSDDGIPAGSFQLHACMIEDVLSFMETLEDVVSYEKN